MVSLFNTYVQLCPSRECMKTFTGCGIQILVISWGRLSEWIMSVTKGASFRIPSYAVGWGRSYKIP